MGGERKIIRWIGIKDCFNESENESYQARVIIELVRSENPNIADRYDIQTYDYDEANITQGQWARTLGSAKRTAMKDSDNKSKEFVWTKEILV